MVVVFQPHRYTRTRDLLSEFASSFADADEVFVTEIYPAGEPPISGVSGAAVARAIQQAGHPSVTWVPRKEELVDRLMPALKPGDLVLTLGAGDIWKAGTQLLEQLEYGAP